MGSYSSQSQGPNGIADSPSPKAELFLTPSAKRQKIDHRQSHHRPPHSATPENNVANRFATMPPISVLETLQLEHVPPTHSVHVAIFRDVENAAFLHQQLLARNADFEYALIDAAVVRLRSPRLFIPHSPLHPLKLLSHLM